MNLTKIYLLISIVTPIFIDDFRTQFSILCFLNFIFYICTKKNKKIFENIIIQVFYLVFLFSYIMKLQISLLLNLDDNNISNVLDVFYLATASHFILVFSIIAFAKIFKLPEIKSGYAASGINQKKEIWVLIMSIVLIVFSSIIYYKYKLYVMGSEMVVLPFKINAILFYARTIFVPILLLSVLYTTKKNKMETLSIVLLLLLGLSDMIQRESKGALIYIVIQLFIVLKLKSSYIKTQFNYKPFLVFFIVVVSFYSIIRDAREQTSSNSVSTSINNSEKLFIIEGAIQIMNRFQGYTQFCRIYNLQKYNYREMYFNKSISQTYTNDFLGQPEHIINQNSPSLLGISYLFYGNLGVFFLPSLYIIFLLIMFKFIFLFLKSTKIPFLAYSVFEIINSTIAGTVDTSLISLIVGFLFALFIELYLRSKIYR